MTLDRNWKYLCWLRRLPPLAEDSESAAAAALAAAAPESAVLPPAVPQLMEPAARFSQQPPHQRRPCRHTAAAN